MVHLLAEDTVYCLMPRQITYYIFELKKKKNYHHITPQTVYTKLGRDWTIAYVGLVRKSKSAETAGKHI